MEVSAFLRWLSQRTGASVLVAERESARVVTLEVQNRPLSEVLGLLGRHLGVQVAQVGGSWFLGDLRAEDKGVLVRRVRGLDQDGLSKAIATALSEIGRVATYGDGLLVVGDRVEVLARVADLCDGIEAQAGPVWVVQLYVVNVNDTRRQTLGIDARPIGQLAARLATGTPDLVTAGVGIDAALQTAFQADGLDIIARPMFLLSDGVRGSFVSGVNIPIPKKSVSNEGTVQTLSYDYVNTGLTATCAVREVAGGRVRLTVNLELGQLTGYVEEAPVRSQDVFSTEAVVDGGGVYLLGSLRRTEKSSSLTGIASILPTKITKGSTGSDCLIWARVYRCGSQAQ